MELNEFLLNQAISYLGRYPATKKKLAIHLEKKIKSKSHAYKYKFSKDELKFSIEQVIEKIVDLKMLDEKHYLESLFTYYCRSMFSIKKMKNKFYIQGFEKDDVDEFINNVFFEDPDLEFNILVNFIKKKNLKTEDELVFRKKLFQVGFSNEDISRFLKD
jgi:SOS response regulatory protein OraA/RecX|tara:strand:+ start:1213 stop:1692 length:480 start_codon:yes stop_codon:yes gene_type:complete